MAIPSSALPPLYQVDRRDDIFLLEALEAAVTL
jgi:hypothetical protein